MSDKSVIRVKKIICEECKGKGTYHHFTQCRNCLGTGEVEPYERLYGETYRGQTCRDCVPSREVLNIPGYSNGLIYEGYKKCTFCHGGGCYYVETDDPNEATAILASVI